MMKLAWTLAALVVVVAWCSRSQAQGMGANVPTPPKAPAADKTAREASKITFDVKDAVLSDVVAKLAEQSGNKPILIEDAALRDKTVTLSVKDVTYWEAVTKVAESLGLVYEIWNVPLDGRGGDGRIQFLEADRDAKLTGCAGPAVVRVNLLSLVAPLCTVKGAPRRVWGDPNGFNLYLEYFWEDRVDPLTGEIELLKTQPDKGPSVLPADAAARRKAGQGGYFLPGGKAPPGRACNFNLPLPSPDAKLISELSGVVRLEFGTGEQEYQIDDVLHNVGKEITVGDWTIKVLKADVAGGNTTVQMDVKYKGEPADNWPLWWISGSYGWHLKSGDDGKRVRGTPTGGTWTRTPKVAGKPPVPVPPRKGEQNVMFQIGEADADLSLVLLLPKTHETKEYPFTIKDIPLP